VLLRNPLSLRPRVSSLHQLCLKYLLVEVSSVAAPVVPKLRLGLLVFGDVVRQICRGEVDTFSRVRLAVPLKAWCPRVPRITGIMCLHINFGLVVLTKALILH
jgi:hypothetical protein